MHSASQTVQWDSLRQRPHSALCGLYLTGILEILTQLKPQPELPASVAALGVFLQEYSSALVL